ncbi:nitrogen fixation protein FixH [Mucilaginibacter sp. HC2]|uniref:FixH family protein n=1 Tax=Mucilaginibacter inviolabilis TaxID=2714892 RepID=UPI00140E66B8|nr:FixH family protein [Mucilaginibacter inviolabilis]NHA02613.1 nitrogen fixation protein FixH [Mucilaginibacter inviolabilis]
MNWGKGLITGMILFMLFISAMGVRMFMVPGDDYDHQYYEKGLTFNRDYDREKQVTTDHATPVIEQVGQTLVLRFKTPLSGSIRFERPSDQLQDRSFPLRPDESNKVVLPVSNLAAGKWQLTLNWQNQGKAYLYHQEITIR